MSAPVESIHLMAAGGRQVRSFANIGLAETARPRYGDRVMAGQPTLFIFPHAGGSAEYYIPFARAFSSKVKRVAVQYPGRRGTHDVGSFSAITDLADQACAMLDSGVRDGGPVAFFGHSMGALVAFEAALRFEAQGNSVAALFVSACAAPGRAGFEYVPEHDRGLLDVVSELTGANREFLENEEFAAKILPTLRGMRAIANYDCPADATVSCPIHAYLGDEDDVATYEKVQSWAQRTTGEFSARVFRGHHFYVDDHVTELAGDIEQKIAVTCSA